MSLNIGNDGINAVRALRTHPAWADLVKGLAEECRKKTISALEADAEHQPQAAGYARALMDVCVAFQAAELNVQPQVVKKPGPLKDV